MRAGDTHALVASTPLKLGHREGATLGGTMRPRLTTLALILASLLLVNVLMAGLFSLVALWAD